MPYRLDTHVLTVDANVIHKVDTANPANLYSMWTDSVEQGRRLENLSWRLWQREQLVETEDKPAPVSTLNTAPQTLPQLIPESRLPEVPQLSGSVDSLVDDEAVEFTSVSAPLEIARPRILRQDSSISRSRRDRHISSDDFEKMIVSIVKDRAPLSAPTTQTSLLMARKEASRPLPTLERSGSTTTTDSQSPSKTSEQASELSQSPPEEASRTTVVRGFSPSQATFTRDSTLKSHDIPEPTSAPAPKPVQSKNKSSMWTLGGSCSSSELGHSVETRTVAAPVSKKPVFQIGGSSEEDGSLKSAMHSARSPLQQKKQTSFANVVTTRTIASEAAVDSDSEPEYVDESAIDDDDDSSDWEDSLEDSGKSSMDDKFFQRIDSKANLTSRPSLITLMLAQSERAKNLGNHASQSTSAIPRARMAQAPSLAASPNDSDEAPLMMKGMRQSTLKPIIEAPRAPIPRSTAQPIAPTSNPAYAQAALSPRTTRRNMLATELTESLRRHLLWERQQKSSTANAVLKRRHTSHDVANLKQYPERHCLKASEDVNASSWNQYFNKEAFDGYHSKGW
ncbi:hypothetical protein B0I35DRAFT_356271 [Stachybotrys elegans]|uniref:Nitrogen regulatory protein areA GATA-like domain-containing protein n=1 Tax=Stachybotrys elegans TaxID=80388 RepID=A0A8K0WNY9_9HYPO|nr:hypothetical protein B0I35DRAFT_356271 [Stachybotrys elegans]